jgi:hypothetical protein
MAFRIPFTNRYAASAAHLALSAAVAGTVFVLVYCVWYPLGLFSIAGGRELFALIAVVNVVAGPLLTLVVFVPGKRGLGFDLLAIALTQVAALAYGVNILSESRPAFLVFSKDRFELVRANDLDPEQLAKAKPPFSEVPLAGPIVAGALLPTNREELDLLVFLAPSGIDVTSFPRYFVPYDRVRADVRAKAAPIAGLRKLNAPQAVDAALRETRLGERDLRFLPVRAGKIDLTALVDAAQGDVVRVVALKPWEFK